MKATIEHAYEIENEKWSDFEMAMDSLGYENEVTQTYKTTWKVTTEAYAKLFCMDVYTFIDKSHEYALQKRINID